MWSSTQMVPGPTTRDWRETVGVLFAMFARWAELVDGRLARIGGVDADPDA